MRYTRNRRVCGLHQDARSRVISPVTHALSFADGLTPDCIGPPSLSPETDDGPITRAEP